MARPMNENYLNYLFAASGSTMNYPLWTTIGETFYNDSDLVIPVKRKEISFIKKEIPKFNFEESTNFMSDEEFENFQNEILSSLKLPGWFFASTYGVISDPTPQIFDEFH